MARKTKLGLTPSDFYDAGVIARALEAKAEQGLHLREIGTYLMYYDRGEPKRQRYWVEYAPNRSGEPDADFLEICRQAGWEYVGCIRRLLFVLRAVRPDAEALHTDPQVQAMSMRRAVRLICSNALINVLGLLAIAFIFLFWGVSWRAPLVFLLEDDRIPILLLFLILELLTAILSLIDAVRVWRFRRALSQGETPPPDTKGVRRMRVCRLVGAVTLLLAFVVCCLPFLGLFVRTEDIAGRDDLVYIPLEVWQQDPNYTPTPPMYSGGYNIFACVEYGRSLLTAEQYEVYESGKTTDYGLPDGLTAEFEN